jgi:threonine synthase
MEEIRRHIYSVSVSDEQTRKTIQSVYKRYHVVLEQHGAVGWAGLEDYLNKTSNKNIAICLETAHPAKFPEEIQKLLGLKLNLPESLKDIDRRAGNAISMTNNYDDFKKHLRESLKIKE